MFSFLDLPDEVIIYIATYINITDVVSLRKACRRCSLLSHDRAIWKTIIQSQSKKYPMPRGINSTATFPEAQTKDLEDLATSVHVTAKSWLRHRPPALSLRADVALSYDRIQDMQILLDRWLLVFLDRNCEVWDLHPSDKDPDYIGLSRTGAWARGTLEPVCSFHFGDERHGYYASSAVCEDSSGDAIILAITWSTGGWDSPEEQTTTLRRIRLTSDVAELELLGSISGGPSTRHSLTIDSNSQVVAFSDVEGDVCFWHWPTNFYWTTHPEEQAEAGPSSAVIAVQFLTPRHLICLRGLTVDLLTLDFLVEVSQGGLRADAIQFQGKRVVPRSSAAFSCLPMHFAKAMFSKSQTIHSESSITVTSTFLGYIPTRGLFHYAVNARFPRSSEPCLSMVSLVGGESTSPPLDINATLVAKHSITQYAICGCALGPQGKRGVWFEHSGDTPASNLQVFGFATDDYGPGDDSETTVDDTSDFLPKTIQGRPIYEVKDIADKRAFDDAVIHCVLSETAGTVVLGTYRGQLLALYPSAGGAV
ncbi:hypothetical protein BC835DRAFT_488113 [Cytidiella melzeri]|nr:hypothetical protein BC835DRAFT_488113 [Cytidiella melzeri]